MVVAMGENAMRLINAALQYDHLTFYWCQQRHCRRFLITISRQVSRSADGYLYLLFGIVALFREHHQFLKVGIIAFILERGFYYFLKKYVKRNRPPDILPGFKSIIRAADKFSFPSGHTSAAFLMATLLAFYIPATAWLMYPWACCVAWSRIMLGVHFPTDTLAGAILGSSIALGSMGVSMNLF
jgi:undecaprenyl-diphosphatase